MYSACITTQVQYLWPTPWAVGLGVYSHVPNPFLLIFIWRFTLCFHVTTYTIDHIEFSTFFWAFFSTVSDAPWKSSRWVWQASRPKATLPGCSLHPVSSHPPSVLSPLTWDFRALPGASCSHLTASSLPQSHNLQQEGGKKTHHGPSSPSVSCSKCQSLWRHIQSCLLPCLDHLSCVNQQRWAIMGDLNKQADPYHSSN